MPKSLYKLIGLIAIVFLMAAHNHPIYMSVTEIEHNEKDKTLEVSCKIYTDDFEKTLRAAYNTKIDLLDEKLKPQMDKIVSDYISKHLKIYVNAKQLEMAYVGFEQIEEGIYCYFEVSNVPTLKTIDVFDDVLFEYKPEQISLLHMIENGNRQTTKITAPQNSVTFKF